MKMDIKIVALLLVLFGQVQSFSSRRLCDIRIWYLNLVANDVFNMELNTKQTDLKNNIETLVLNSSDKPESRFKDCHVLEMYNDMLKESLSFDYSSAQNIRDYVVREEPDSKDVTDKIKEKINDKDNDQDHKESTENSDNRKQPENKESEKDSKDEKDTENMASVHRDDNGQAEDVLTDDSAEHVDDNHENVDSLSEQSNDSLQEDDIDETEIFDEEDDDLKMFEDDSIIAQNEQGVEPLQNIDIETEEVKSEPLQDKDIKAEKVKSHTLKVKSIPFGICWSFSCVWSEIFTQTRNDTQQQETRNKSVEQNDSISPTIFTITMCYSKLVCTKLCYYITFNRFCLLDYENILEKSKKMSENDNSDLQTNKKLDNLNSKENINDIEDDESIKKEETVFPDENLSNLENIDGTEIKKPDADKDLSLQNEDTIQERKKNSDDSESNLNKINENISDNDIINQQKSIEEMEKDFMVYNEQPLKTAKEAGSRMSLDDFEKLIHQKTSDYAHKIQSLELMIVNLEKQLLLEQLNKQNHTSYYTKLENLVLKLENDLLRMNRFYQSLKDETDAMNQKQNHYLELAYKQEQEKKYLELPDKSSQNFELITQHQSKIAELSDILKNQSNMINQMKTRHESLEEQNRMLHQMVMNQTIFMTSIIQTVQDLSDQNSKGKMEMLELKQKLDNALKEKSLENKKQSVVEEKEKHTKNMIDTIDSYASDTIVNIKSLDDTSDFQAKIDTKSVQETFKKWCPSNKNICPACLYNSVMVKNCVPYSRAFWSTCKETCKTSKKTLPISPDVEDSQSEDKLIVDNNIVEEDKKEDTPEKYHNINIDMAIIDDKHVDTNKNLEDMKVLQEDTGDDSVKTPDEVLNQNNKIDELNMKEAPGEPDVVQNKPDAEAPTTSDDKQYKQDKQVYIQDKNIVENTGHEIDKENNDIKKDEKTPESSKEGLESNSEKDVKSEPDNKSKNTKENVSSEKKEEKKVPIEEVNHKKKENNMNVEQIKQKNTKEINVDKNSAAKQKDKIQEKDDTPSEKSVTGIINNKPEVKGKETKADTKQDDGSTKTAKTTGKKIQATKKQPKKEPLYMGRDKQKEPKDCYEIYRRGSKGDGIYKVRPLGSKKVFEVFCDMKKGGWTVIQRRQDGSTNFFLGWEDYKKGFGGLYGEHWIGNEALHYLTNQDYYKLRVDLIDWDKNKKYADFDYFLVENEDEGYRLNIDGYTGDAGDGLSKHNGHKFSTKDVDNDKVVTQFGGSCANRFHGAGWYYKCYVSNLNGKYYKGGKIPEKMYDGVTWKPWTGPNYSIKKVVMKVRPTSGQDK